MLMHKTSIARRIRARTSSIALGLATLGACLAAPITAWAGTCVTLDEQRDGLADDERQAARTLFEEALAERGVEVSRDACTETWVIYHVKLGKTVTVVVQSPRGTRRERVKTLEDLPAVYSQLTRAILTGTENTTESANVDRRNVTEAQTETRRVVADAIWYAKLGYGATPALDFKAGPSFGFGRRWELDRIGIDLSFLNFLLYQNSDGIDGTSIGWVELGVDYFFDPYANNTPFIGAGLSLGSHVLPGDNGTEDYTGGGLQGKVALGYELFRASTIRLLIEADARLPFHRLSHDEFDPATNAIVRDHIYAPTFALSLGIGWGRSNN
jgi:hypothetical protein